jgi:hypothetical protein
MGNAGWPLTHDMALTITLNRTPEACSQKPQKNHLSTRPSHALLCQVVYVNVTRLFHSMDCKQHLQEGKALAETTTFQARC